MLFWIGFFLQMLSRGNRYYPLYFIRMYGVAVRKQVVLAQRNKNAWACFKIGIPYPADFLNRFFCTKKNTLEDNY